jgi:hypothetical protein
MSPLKVSHYYMNVGFILLLCVILLFTLLLFSSFNSYMLYNLQQAMAQFNTIIPIEFATAVNSLRASEDSTLRIKVYYESSGGIMGTRTSVLVDTNSLPPDEARQLRDLINNSNFFDLPSKSPPPQKGAADYFLYKITVEADDDERKTHTIQTNDITMPPELAPLIDFLQGKALKN